MSKSDVVNLIRKGSKKQALLCLFIALMNTCVSIEQVIVNFITPTNQDYWCHIKGLNCTIAEQKSVMNQLEKSVENYDRCRKYDINWNDDSSSCEVTDFTSNSSQSCKTGYTFDTEIFTQTVISRFELVCEKKWISDWLTTIYVGGLSIGSLVGGVISDKFGRKFTLMLFNSVHIFGGVIAAFVPNVWLFLAGRILVAIALRGVGLTAITFLMEIFPSKRIQFASLTFQFTYVMGFYTIDLMAFFIRDDSWLQLSGCLPFVIFFLGFWIIPESPLWLISKRKYGKAREVLHTFAGWSSSRIPDDILQEYTDTKITTTNEDNHENLSQPEKLTIIDLFRHKKLAYYTVSITVIVSSIQMTYLGITFTIGSLFGDPFTNIAISATIELGGLISFGLFARNIRRKLSILCFLFILLSCHITAIVYLNFNQPSMVETGLALTMKLMCNLTMTVSWLYVGELFPTAIRQQANGLANTVASVVIIMGPYISDNLKKKWSPYPYIIYGGATFVCFVLTLFLPETKGLPLPEKLDDILKKRNTCKVKPISKIPSPDKPILTDEMNGHFNSAFQ